MKSVAALAVASALPLLALGCTWVSPTAAGAQVRILPRGAVAECRGLGKVTAQTRDRVGVVLRAEPTVREELNTLARNEAAQMGGDAIVPDAAPEDGRQSFSVFRCR